jgi:hypothetical protein
MGRGRAKAKQTKVARELKYHSPNTDLAALQRELGSSRAGQSDSDVEDEYDEYLDDDDDDDGASDDDDDDAPDDGNWAARRR